MTRRNQVASFLLSLLALLVLTHGSLLAQVVYSPSQLRLNAALTAAVRANDTSASLSLLAAGADPNAISVYIYPTPDNPQQVPDAIIQGAILGRTHSTTIYTTPPLLVEATSHGNARLVIALLDHGAHPEAQMLIRNAIPPVPPVTALYIAVLNNMVEIVRALLNHGANPRNTPSLNDSLLQHTKNVTILNMLRQALPKDTQVWVDFKTRQYHFPETRWYGKTKTGDYMSEQDAINAGYGAAERWQDYLCR
jgi:hypothetical protein